MDTSTLLGCKLWLRCSGGLWPRLSDRGAPNHDIPPKCKGALVYVDQEGRTGAKQGCTVQETPGRPFLQLVLGEHQGDHATARFLEGFSDGSLKEVLLRRVLKNLAL